MNPHTSGSTIDTEHSADTAIFQGMDVVVSREYIGMIDRRLSALCESMVFLR